MNIWFTMTLTMAMTLVVTAALDPFVGALFGLSCGMIAGATLRLNGESSGL
jgi:hypothetical protein